jgi:hypothetical protein
MADPDQCVLMPWKEVRAPSMELHVRARALEALF